MLERIKEVIRSAFAETPSYDSGLYKYCPECNGVGGFDIGKCDECDGKGVIKKSFKEINSGE